MMERRVSRDLRDVAILGVALAAVYLLVVGPLDSEYLIPRLVITGCIATAVIGLAVVVGAGQQFHLGLAFFFGLSAYWVAWSYGMEEWPLPLSIVSMFVVVWLVSFAIGSVLGRLTGLYYAIATLALAILGTVLVYQMGSFTGGEDGRALPYLQIGSFSVDTNMRTYVAVWSVALPAVFVARRYLASRRGVMTRAVGLDEEAARSIGISAKNVRLSAFVVSAQFAGVGGAMFALVNGFIYPGNFDLVVSIQMIVYSIAGLGGVVGGLVATLVIGLVPVVFDTLSKWTETITGALLVLIMIVDLGGIRDAISRRLFRPLMRSIGRG